MGFQLPQPDEKQDVSWAKKNRDPGAPAYSQIPIEEQGHRGGLQLTQKNKEEDNKAFDMQLAGQSDAHPAEQLEIPRHQSKRFLTGGTKRILGLQKLMNCCPKCPRSHS